MSDFNEILGDAETDRRLAELQDRADRMRATILSDFSSLTDEQLLAKAKQLRDEWEGSLKEKASEGRNSSGHDEPHAS